MQMALCQRTFKKIKMPHMNMTQMSEGIKKIFIPNNTNPSVEDITHKIVEYLNNNATITIINTRTNNKILITSEDEYILWATKFSGFGITDIVISCTYQTIDSTNVVSDILVEFTWVDYYAYKDIPLLIVQIFEYDTDKLLEERVYKTDIRMWNFLEKSFMVAESDEGVRIPVYKDNLCRVVVNKIDISEYFTNPDTHFVPMAYLNTSEVLFDVMMDGLI